MENYHGLFFGEKYTYYNGFTLIAGTNKKQDWKWKEWWERKLG
jgi:hypothetical protein